MTPAGRDHETADAADAAAAVLVAERPRLRALAYRMLGSLSEAEDVVQEAGVRWIRLGPDGRRAVDRPAAWLTTTTTRLALDVLRSARRRREEYVGPWLPEPVLAEPGAPEGDPALVAELSESLTLGFLTVLDRLDPVERAVFLLADVFDEPYTEIAAMVGRSEEACRQIASRARRRVQDERRRAAPGATHPDDLVASFLAACLLGDLDDLRRVLRHDVVLVSDGGPHRRAARHPVLGVDRVARFVSNLARRVPPGADLSTPRVNGEPGLVVRIDGEPWMVMAFEVDGDRIVTLRLVLNPDKLGAIAAS
jgi:RNA polymerase sigma-70 factor (ECF subfamily)